MPENENKQTKPNRRKMVVKVFEGQTPLHRAIPACSSVQIPAYFLLALLLVATAFLAIYGGPKALDWIKAREGVEVAAQPSRSGLFAYYTYEYEGESYRSNQEYPMIPFFHDTVILDPILPAHVTPGSVYKLIKVGCFALAIWLCGEAVYILVLTGLRIIKGHREPKTEGN